MSKKIKYISLVVIFLIVVMAILLHNRASLKASEKIVKVIAYPVNVDTVKSMNFLTHLDMVGTIEADNDVRIVSEAQGKVVKVSANVGDYKYAGSTLIQLEDALELSTFKTATVNYQKAKKNYERYTALFKEKSVTDSQIENAQLALTSADAQLIAARKHYEDTKITAPISGFITYRPVNIGDYVTKRTVVAEIVDISILKVKINVSEQDVFSLKVGDRVDVKTGVYPGVIFKGVIKTISVKGDMAHNYPVEVDLKNSKKYPLRAGMFANVLFTSKEKYKSLVIPREALLGSVKNAQVYVVENNVAKLRHLVIGKSSNNNLEVLSGLKKGDIVVVNGQNNLKQNYKVKLLQ